MMMMIVLVCFVYLIWHLLTILSEVFLVLVKEAYGDSLDKGFMYVEIFPFLR